MRFIAFLVAVTMVSAKSKSALPPGLDPRCKKMDKNQWDAFENNDSLRKVAFASFGLADDYPYAEILFGDDINTASYFCAEGWNAIFEPATELQCNQIIVEVFDESHNAPGSVAINVQSGVLTSTTLTDTDTYAVGGGVTTTLNGLIPLNTADTVSIQFTVTYTKAQATAQTFQTNTLSWVQRVINVGSGNSNCTAEMTVTSCQHEANGEYPIIASGWIGWRLNDEHSVNGKKARRWYVFVDSLPRQLRIVWGKTHAGIVSQTYSTTLSQCHDPKPSKRSRHARLARSKPRAGAVKAEILDDARDHESVEEKLLRAKAGVPDHLKPNIMRVGNTIILPAMDID
ncbi:unnamed protein product [Rhizoctonia solani]|uniref:Uncharacterized protein n=1 Tax=Rhizoctonia solani TaxID=456999 RepID=A0A8H3GRK5_9AGAM|nr:unnamed protein product [Rhizoctonia solani]